MYILELIHIDLESENIKLNESHRVIENELEESKQNYQQARKAYLNTVNEKINQETVFESFITKVKYELSEKSKEFDQLREKFSPQDLELIRIKIQEEIEIRFTGKIEEANAETELYKSQTSTIRRELDKMRSIMETKEAVYKRDYEAIVYENEAVIQQLRHNLSILENEKQFPDQADSTRNLKHQIEELRSTVSHMQAEAQTLNMDKISLMSELEDSRTINEQLKFTHREKINTFESSRIEADMNMKLLHSELINKESSLSTVQKELETLMIEDRKLRTFIHTLESNLTEKSSTLTTALRDENKHLQLENIRLLSEMSRLVTAVTQLEDTLRLSQKENSDLQSFIERNDSKTRRIHQSEVQKLNDRIQQDEIYLASRDNEVRIFQSRYNKLNESYPIDIEVLKNEITKLKRESSILNSRLQSSEYKGPHQ